MMKRRYVELGKSKPIPRPTDEKIAYEIVTAAFRSAQPAIQAGADASMVTSFLAMEFTSIAEKYRLNQTDAERIISFMDGTVEEMLGKVNAANSALEAFLSKFEVVA